MKKISIAFVLFLFMTLINSQELISIKDAGDCASAIEVSTLSKFGPTTPPKEVKIEAANNPFSKSLYQVWYKFTTEKEGKLLFDIIPLDPADNYDFLLYKSESSNSCNDIKTGKISILRDNITRNEPQVNGMTGLSMGENSDSYSPGIDVKKGEQYLLAINSMYKCKGHSIVFKYLESYKIKGKVSNVENGNALPAQVFWTNIRSKETSSSIVTDKQGEFILPVLVNSEAHRFPDYLLWVYAEGYFIADTILASKDIPKIEKMNFSLKLNKLKKGNNQFLPMIFFEPNYERIVSESLVELDKVLRLMQQNQKIEIILEGHSNGFYPSTEVDNVLSLKRAETVKKWLVENGISADRIETKAFGSEKMLYPTAQDEKEEQMNRRVEINISKF
jgi:outer membrane protein OmpA-like peptidoglycan-associated protein